MLVDLEKAIPQIWEWMQETITHHSHHAMPVERYGFTRLSKCFSSQTIQSAKVVEVDGLVPRPPLKAMGLAAFAAFEETDFAGITFGQTYFLKRAQATSEALHFHELVHVVQWTRLGPVGFLTLYAKGLAKYGYENSPLEKVAYGLQERFVRGALLVDAEKEIARELGQA